jgi:methionine synthase I (cobalamin-dependent)/5,10-methylenetetrahydrofolate reductase
MKTLSTGSLLADGAMGSYLFEQTGRLSEINHVYEALNCDNPDLIIRLHLNYLQAGARCLTTNTFSANMKQLKPLGEEARLIEINQAAVNLAQQAIKRLQQQTQKNEPCFVLGSIGPTPHNDVKPDQIELIYGQQVKTLISSGVDALVLETFSSLSQLKALLELIKTMDDAPPVIAQMTLRQSGAELKWSQDPKAFIEIAADSGAAVAGVNCCAPWEAINFVNDVTEVEAVKNRRVYLTAMPNAADFQRIGGRYMSRVNPEYMGKLARTLADSNVHLIGGCCEIHPPYINQMHNYLTTRQRDNTSASISLATHEAIGDNEKKANGSFSRKIKTGEFAVSVEILPIRGTGPKVLESKVQFVRDLVASGLADAIDMTDSSRGIPLMPPGDFIALLREKLQWNTNTGDALEFIPHYTTRDLNAMGLQSRLMGYWGNRIHNVLFITGDPPKMSPTYPASTAVFDLDSIGMIKYTNACLNSGVDFGGQPLSKHADPRTHFTIGSGFEPEAINTQHEIEKLRKKIESGADYIMTQPAFRFEPLDTLQPFRDQVAIVVGVMILTSLEQAKRVDQIPGVVIPQKIFQRLSEFKNSQDQAKAGLDIALEQIKWVKKNSWAGLYLMSPSSHHSIIELLKAAST